MHIDLIDSFFVIFSGAAILASLALFTRQPLIIAYILLGCMVGPYGFKLVTEQALLSEIAEFGIIFLLFLLGLDLQAKNLLYLFGRSSIIALISSAIFAGLGFLVSYAFSQNIPESIIVGLACMFSSTIIAIKLLPTTVLHHKHTGEIVVGLLLMQDLIAIFVLIALEQNSPQAVFEFGNLFKISIALLVSIGMAFFLVKILILPLIKRFDRFQEYIFLIAIGWCLGIAELSKLLGLSLEIGAFIAGISLASSPISAYIANNLKPLRDFFLVLFFFSLGASFNFHIIPEILIPLLVLSAILLVAKPLVFYILLNLSGEDKTISREVGFRLGQTSEFSLLIAYLAFNKGFISNEASHLIQATAILSFLLSSYVVIFFFPNPIAVFDRLRKD
jgi:Kef-type K+ transport system membrane component KefB